MPSSSATAFPYCGVWGRVWASPGHLVLETEGLKRPVCQADTSPSPAGWKTSLPPSMKIPTCEFGLRTAVWGLFPDGQLLGRARRALPAAPAPGDLAYTPPSRIIATPGRLVHVAVEMNLRLQSVEYVVFDEADR